MSEIEKEPSGKPKLSFQVGAEIFKFIVAVFWFNVFPSVINTQIS